MMISGYLDEVGGMIVVVGVIALVLVVDGRHFCNEPLHVDQSFRQRL